MENGSKADINVWLKGLTAFGRSKDHSAKEVAKAAGVCKSTVIRIYLHGAQIPVYREFSCRIVPEKVSTKSDRTAQFFDVRESKH